MKVIMEINKVDLKTEYEEYKKLILRRDRLKKEASSCNVNYYILFGDLITQSFQLQVECISLKKKINYCQNFVNNDKEINEHDLHTYIDSVMQSYNKKLQDLVEDVEISKQAKQISEQEVLEIKHLYYKIAKKIHPDMNPTLFANKKVRELWERTAIAYNCNILSELQDINVLVDELCLENVDYKIEKVDSRIKKLKEEIETIINTFPYKYKFILDDQNEIKERREEIQEEIDEYKEYKQNLEKKLKKFDIKIIIN